MKGVKYIGQVFNQSGYAEAARNYILALHQLGVPVTVDAIRHSDQQPDLGRDGEVLASLVDRPIEYDRIILHDTPDTWAHRLRDEPPGVGVVGLHGVGDQRPAPAMDQGLQSGRRGLGPVALERRGLRAFRCAWCRSR